MESHGSLACHGHIETLFLYLQIVHFGNEVIIAALKSENDRLGCTTK
jgi:hypothetical protein